MSKKHPLADALAVQGSRMANLVIPNPFNGSDPLVHCEKFGGHWVVG
jgi:hypothetical protein